MESANNALSVTQCSPVMLTWRDTAAAQSCHVSTHSRIRCKCVFRAPVINQLKSPSAVILMESLLSS